jgi:hypothetical protein
MHHADRNAHASGFRCANTGRPLLAPRASCFMRAVKRITQWIL